MNFHYYNFHIPVLILHLVLNKKKTTKNLKNGFS